MTEPKDTDRVPSESELAIEHHSCSKCLVKAGKRCKSKSGVEYPPSTVHGPRLKAYRETHGMNWNGPDHPEAVFVSQPDHRLVLDHEGPASIDPNWTRRYEMVRGVFRIMTKLDGHEGTLDYLARLVVEMDVDLMILEEARKQQ
jgi:hypothetical protein